MDHVYLYSTLTDAEKKAKGREAYQAISDRIMEEIGKLKHPSDQKRSQ